jgi:FkbM family methyltransferase
MKHLIVFRHGLGDALQLTCVLRHLRHYHPDWIIDVAALKGKHSAFGGLADKVFILDLGEPLMSGYDQVHRLEWGEPTECYSGKPSTKAEKCLLEVFGLEPIPKLCRYSIQIGSSASAAAAQYLEEISGPAGSDGRFRSILIHYEGNTAAREKNLSHTAAQAICRTACFVGFTPVILDWDRRSPLPDGKTIFCPDANHPLWLGYGTGDAERLAALIELSSLFIGIDSGPQKVAGATTTPALAVWTRHHPIHYQGLANNVTHLVPEGIDGLLRGGPKSQIDGSRAFNTLYKHATYSNITGGIIARIQNVQRKGSLVKYGEFWIREDNADQDLVIVRDVYEEDAYGTSLLSNNGGHEIVVDIGAHIGSFAKLWHKKNPKAEIICVEACPENMEALQANVGDFAQVVPAACTYETGEVGLLNAVHPNCESTGSSTVLSVDRLYDTRLWQVGYRYTPDLRPLPKVTLEDLMNRFGADHIDVLKLDCEESEFSILANTPSLQKIRMILGEYHGEARWNAWRERVLAGWKYRHMFSDPKGYTGLFHYTNPIWGDHA